MKFPCPVLSIFSVVDATRRPGEDRLDACQRLMVEEAMYRAEGCQKKAAALLGCSPRVLNYHLERLGLRPMDEKRRVEVQRVPAAAGGSAW